MQFSTPLTDITPSSATRDERREKRHPMHSGVGVWSSVQLDCVSRTVELYDWSPSTLRPYHAYGVLHAERKFAKPVAKERQTLSFLDLPGEIRNRIFMLSLKFDDPFELATFNEYHSIARRNREHYKEWRNNVKPVLSLLRLNKQLNAEAAGIFYGYNDFRFTNICGHEILLAFCKTIGLPNTQRLARITEHAPYEGIYVYPYSGPENNKPIKYKIKFQAWAAKVGLHMQGTKAGHFKVAHAIAGKEGALREYKMIIPAEMDIWSIEPPSDPQYLSTYIFNGTSSTKISLVLFDMRCLGLFVERIVRFTQYSLRGEFELLAKRRGWQVIETQADRFGDDEAEFDPEREKPNYNDYGAGHLGYWLW